MITTILNLVSGPVRYALVAGIVPFFFTLNFYNNGVYRDYVAIPAGGIAILLGLMAFTQSGNAENKAAHVGLCLLALALGALQLARGFGLYTLSLG